MAGEQKQNDLLHSYGFLKYIFGKSYFSEYQEILTLFLSVPGNNVEVLMT